ncbi:MAG: nucleotidyltransferase domain-containing protein [Elusimicrobia bacterium]|nr:nucleotidyltransferase domain-containing protein [Elusimicrobiota bacterium]
MEILQIIKSKLRKELLSLYFTNPEKKYYLRELERILSLSVANIRRELINLEKTGLFQSEKKGNLTYYFLNKEYPLYTELKSIVFNTIGIRTTIKSMLEKIEGIKISFIYGSFAKNEQNQASDIDVFIIGKVDENKLVETFGKLERKLQREINYSLYEYNDFKRKKNGKNPFIAEVLKQPKIFLIGDKNVL